ncbi:MAG: hypothetical protein J0M08_00095 [Bacteroidetes bacterium]|nr:hypothetical protein [Bacteroidota bacterium]
MIKILFRNIFLLAVLATLFTSCAKESTATKILMQGNWELTEAYDAAGNDILSQISFPVTAIQLTDDNGMLGTQAPLATRLVYGNTNWSQASGKMNQVFDYANLRFNTGEFFVGEGVTDVFTVEFKLQATAIAGGLSDILTIFGVGNGWLQQTIYHKFTNVSVVFPEQIEEDVTDPIKSATTMIWEFNENTNALYNYKDSQGNYTIWNGWPVNNFTKGKFVFTKKIKGLNDIVSEHL